MASWRTFACVEPEFAAAVRGLVHQYGPGYGYLATIRADGAPRVHPVSPAIVDGGLFCFLMDSPKRRDLLRDDRYALHTFPAEDCDDEAYLTGRARPVEDRDRIRRLAIALRAEPRADWQMFELSIDLVMLTRRSDPAAGDPAKPTSRQTWRDEGRCGSVE
jgi:hypothetical protein